ncbi:5-deoxy-glucuronate isomerase, partial [bacterium]|nr:5-deoxy-glucuronate isomerase [bacterium]
MNRLLIPPERFTDRIDDFGYEFLSFENRKLPAGETFRSATGARELGIVMLGGVCSVNSSEGAFSPVGKRTNVFSGLPHTLYLPIETDFEIATETGCDIAFCYCRAEQRLESRPRHP